MTLTCILCQTIWPLTDPDDIRCPRCLRFSWKLATAATPLDKAITKAHRPDPLTAVQN